MCNSLMGKEVRYSPVLASIRSEDGFKILDRYQPQENFGNRHDKFAKWTAGRMNQFWISIKVAFVVGVGQEEGGQKVNFRVFC